MSTPQGPCQSSPHPPQLCPCRCPPSTQNPEHSDGQTGLIRVRDEKGTSKPCTEAHSFNSSAWEVEAKEWKFKVILGYVKFEASLSYLGSCLKDKKQQAKQSKTQQGRKGCEEETLVGGSFPILSLESSTLLEGDHSGR